MPRLLAIVFLCAGTLLGGPALAGNFCLTDAGDPNLSFPGTSDDNVFAVKPDGNGGYGLSICSPTTIDLSWLAGGYSIADFNQDGWQDLLLGVKSNSGGEIQLLLNDKTGSGTVVLSSTLSTGAAAAPTVVASPDLDGNRWPDIVTANGSDGTFSVMLNDGTGAFPSVKQYAAGSDVALLAALDLNGDNRPDVVAESAQDETLHVFINNGDGTFTLPVTYGMGAPVTSFRITDYSGDGYPDILIGLTNGELLGLLNKGNGSFSGPTVLSAGSGGSGSVSISGGGGVDLTVSTTDPSQLFGGTAPQLSSGTITVASGTGKITVPTSKITVTSSGSSTSSSSSSSSSSTNSGSSSNGSTGSGGGAMEWFSLALLGFAGFRRRKRPVPQPS